MRTETRTYTLYQITELSGEAKEKAHNEWLCNRYFYGWTDENRKTLDTFCECFGIVCGHWRYDEIHYSYDYRSRQKDYIDKLSGWRLATYLTNNHWNDLYTFPVWYYQFKFYSVQRYDRRWTKRCFQCAFTVYVYAGYAKR